ncbi:MAG: hypothetical protein ABIJ45_14090 [Candidatus Zixiibacteriota bacterium]
MKFILLILILALLIPISLFAEQKSGYSGVAFASEDPVVIDVDYMYSTMIYISFDAPENGWVAFDYSFFTETEIYCLELLLSEVRGEDDIPDESRGISNVINYIPDCPTRWNQVMPVSEGMNNYALSVKTCARKDANNTDEKTTVTFRNVNISATFIHEYYGTIRN